jgi:hypothetical protein
MLLLYFKHKFLKTVQSYLLYINDINNGAYYRLWNRVNISLSLVVGLKPGILRPLKMVSIHVSATCLTIICNHMCI